CLILEASPLLTDDDLLELISKSDKSQRLQAVSRRPHLSANVSDAIASTGDSLAVSELLSNGSAQIREDTLDKLVAEAVNQPMWQAPLVERPELSAASLERLATFVKESLLTKLEKHPALDPQAARRLAATIEQRLGSETAGEEADLEKCIEDAREALKQGNLDSITLSDELIAGRKDFVIEGIALLAERPRDFVVKVLDSASAKGVTALCWKAGLTMRLATQIQFQLSDIMPKRALYERSDGEFPLSEDEMLWQLEFFESLESGRSEKIAISG
ncbi:MAG: DUF2336 domain-containing protein, partial [Kiloniellales bacterium]|nr:DUF2336 domain-containing protein [Kiloniellales bacterium]